MPFVVSMTKITLGFWNYFEWRDGCLKTMHMLRSRSLGEQRYGHFISLAMALLMLLLVASVTLWERNNCLLVAMCMPLLAW